MELANAQINMMVGFFFSFISACLTANTEKATDQEWYRIRAFNFFVILF